MTEASSATPEVLADAQTKRRQILPKAERRQQLIDATIRCIAQHGLSAVTMQMVTRDAGLSVGIANLHFESKDNLLKETPATWPRNITTVRSTLWRALRSPIWANDLMPCSIFSWDEV